MKVRHLPSVVRHYPGFVLKNGAGCWPIPSAAGRWRSAMGLEDARAVFARYKAIRATERQYVEKGEGRSTRGSASPVGRQSSGLIRMFL